MPVTTSDREHRIALERVETDPWRDRVLAAPELVAAPVGRPGWWHDLAFDGGTPVSGASMFVAGRYTRLAFAAALLQGRGRGARNTLLAQRVRDAWAAGDRWMSIETAEERQDHPSPSYRNVLRAGFRAAFVRPTYLWRSP